MRRVMRPLLTWRGADEAESTLPGESPAPREIDSIHNVIDPSLSAIVTAISRKVVQYN